MTFISRLLHLLFFDARLQWLRYIQLLLAIVIFAYMALKPPSGASGLLFGDLVLHFIGNILLVASAWYAFFGRWTLRWLLAATFIYSMLIEMAQGLTPARVPDMADASANTLGLLTGIGLCLLLQRLLRQVEGLEQEDKPGK